MKHIIKNSPSAEWRRWFDGQLIGGKQLDCSYENDLSGEIKQGYQQAVR